MMHDCMGRNTHRNIVLVEDNVVGEAASAPRERGVRVVGQAQDHSTDASCSPSVVNEGDGLAGLDGHCT